MIISFGCRRKAITHDEVLFLPSSLCILYLDLQQVRRRLHSLFSYNRYGVLRWRGVGSEYA